VIHTYKETCLVADAGSVLTRLRREREIEVGHLKTLGNFTDLLKA
jgi:hypothetical protein